MSSTDDLIVATEDLDDADLDEIIEEDSDSTDDLEAEVVSDVIEKPRRGRPPKNRDGQQTVPAPVSVEEKSSFTKNQAIKHTEKMRATVETSAEAFVKAYKGRIWLAMDYASWADYLDAQLGDLRPRLPKPQRLELVGAMRAPGPGQAKMSQVAIAAALGVDQKTISTDIQELRDAGEELADTAVGTDGRERRAHIDQSARRKGLVDRVSAVFDKLDKAFGDLTVLGVEEEWDTELSAIASRHRADVAHFLAQLTELQEQFSSAPEFEEEVEAE